MCSRVQASKAASALLAEAACTMADSNTQGKSLSVHMV